MKLYFVAPESLQISPDILALLNKAGLSYELTTDFEKMIPEADAIYMTRIQDEWDTSDESKLIDTSRYHFTVSHLNLLKPDAVILHSLPRRKEIETGVDTNPRAVYWRQVRNGMWIRAALLMMIFGREREVDTYYQDLTS